MKSFIFFVFGAVIGAVGGVVITNYICKGKEEAKIAEVTKEARDFYKDKYEKEIEQKAERKDYEEVTVPYIQHVPEDRIYGNKFTVSETSYAQTDYRSMPIDPNKNKPYLYMVDPDEAGEDPEFTQYSLEYYCDGNLVDEQGNVVDDPLGIAGDYLDDLSLENPQIYVRNDVTKTEYDISYVDAPYYDK